MIALYTDEDVDVLLKPLLMAKGFKVITTLDEGMLGKTDREQLEHAVSLGAIFITHNRVDFERLAAQYTQEARHHEGLILAARRNVYELARRISRFLELNKSGRFRNVLFYI